MCAQEDAQREKKKRKKEGRIFMKEERKKSNINSIDHNNRTDSLQGLTRVGFVDTLALA